MKNKTNVNSSAQKLNSTSLYYQYLRQQQTLEINELQQLPKINFQQKCVGLDNTLPIIQAFSQTTTNFKTFKALKNHYQRINTICKSNALPLKYKSSKYQKLTSSSGLIYKGNYQGSSIERSLCNKFQCARCRPLLKRKLRNEINREIENKKLTTHFVITTEGKDYREKNGYVQSYKDMMKTWNKIRYILSEEAKKQGKHLSYINLPRAQALNGTGYCHLHVVTNIKITQKRLQEISNKYDNTGFVKIREHTNTAKYLTGDFLKDEEFYIPYGQRHYTTSRDISLHVYTDEPIQEDSASEEKFNSTFMHLIKAPTTEMSIFLDRNKKVVDQVYDVLNINACETTENKEIDIKSCGYPPPFEFLLAEFYEGLHSKEKRLNQIQIEE